MSSKIFSTIAVLAILVMVSKGQDLAVGPHLDICKDVDFKNCMLWTIPLDTCVDVPEGWNDVISSFEVEPGVACEKFKDFECQGSFGWAVGEVADLTGTDENDSISSFGCKDLPQARN
ncbi:hypothetical protein BT63DRAFT_410780 [Microthyrium microscopicum]|uniref:Uncharacterized protein n=1 Tax=Microthyrium microscopicum TaxID=703497 RepID=A0A6A6UQ20_9PEZI|nr:hypothetical protein BT63DRAFT_410780 [Microthyrium microscopicum]